MKLGPWLAISATVTVLVAAIVAQSWSARRGESHAERFDFSTLFKTIEASGWRSEPIPLGTTELPEGEIQKILQFDSYAYFRLSKAQRSATIYVAWWGGGQDADSRGGAAHT